MSEQIEREIYDLTVKAHDEHAASLQRQLVEARERAETADANLAYSRKCGDIMDADNQRIAAALGLLDHDSQGHGFIGDAACEAIASLQRQLDEASGAGATAVLEGLISLRDETIASLRTQLAAANERAEEADQRWIDRIRLICGATNTVNEPSDVLSLADIVLFTLDRFIRGLKDQLSAAEGREREEYETRKRAESALYALADHMGMRGGEYMHKSVAETAIERLSSAQAEAGEMREALIAKMNECCEEADANKATQGWHYVTSMRDDLMRILAQPRPGEGMRERMEGMRNGILSVAAWLNKWGWSKNRQWPDPMAAHGTDYAKPGDKSLCDMLYDLIALASPAGEGGK